MGRKVRGLGREVVEAVIGGIERGIEVGDMVQLAVLWGELWEAEVRSMGAVRARIGEVRERLEGEVVKRLGEAEEVKGRMLEGCGRMIQVMAARRYLMAERAEAVERGEWRADGRIKEWRKIVGEVGRCAKKKNGGKASDE